MNIVPPAGTQTVSASKRTLGAVEPLAHGLNDAHPLEKRTAQWTSTQRELRREMMRRNYGVAEPLRRAMEINIVDQSSFVPMALGGPSNLQRDILNNEDATLTWEDVYRDEPSLDFHAEFESRMGL